MKFESVEIEGYGSYYGVHTVPLADQGLVLVLGDNQDEPRMDSNGAAKSTIFEAIDWALFGVVPKGDHVDSIINDESSFARVRVSLFDADHACPVVVQREKTRAKAGKLQYWVGGQSSNEALDVRETQRLLEQELGLDRDVYHAAVFYAQSDLLKFAESTEAKRMELLSKILPELRQIDLWLEPAKQLAKRYADEAHRALVQSSTTQTRAEEAALAVSNFDQQVRDWEANREQRCQAILMGKQQQQQARDKNLELIEQIRRAELELAGMQAPPSEMDAALAEEIKAARSNESAWQGRLRASREQIARLNGRKQRLQQERSGACSLCGQPITEQHLAKELAALDHEVHSEGLTATEAECSAAGWNQRVLECQKKHDEIRRAAAALAQRRGELEGWLHHARQSVKDPTEFDEHLAALDREYASWRNAYNPVQQQKEQCRERASGLLQQAEVARQTAQKWADAQKLADFWVAAFGAKGLRSYVLDHRLKEMTDAANHWVRLLTGGTIWVRFETQRMGRSTRKLSNEINIRVFRFNPDGKITERNYKSWSGGEKRRVGWAIDFGLSRLIAARATKRYDMLVLDEVFRHVDASGGEAVIEMLHELRKERSSIFVIEHDSGFQAHFEKQWLAVKKNARSSLQTVVEGVSDGQRFQVTKGGETGAGKSKKALPPSSPAKARRKPARRAG